MKWNVDYFFAGLHFSLKNCSSWFLVTGLIQGLSNEMQTWITYPLFLMTAIVGNRTHIRLLDTYTHINITWLHTNRYVVEWAIKEFWGFEATLFLHIDLWKSTSILILPRFICLNLSKVALKPWDSIITPSKSIVSSVMEFLQL